MPITKSNDYLIDLSCMYLELRFLHIQLEIFELFSPNLLLIPQEIHLFNQSTSVTYKKYLANSAVIQQVNDLDIVIEEIKIWLIKLAKNRAKIWAVIASILTTHLQDDLNLLSEKQETFINLMKHN